MIHPLLPYMLARRALTGSSLPWGGLQIVPLADTAIGDGQTLDSLTPVLPAQPLPAWTVTPYSAGPPEVLPHASVSATWPNTTGAGVRIGSVAVYGRNGGSGKDDILLWAALPELVTVEHGSAFTRTLRFDVPEIGDTEHEAAIAAATAPPSVRVSVRMPYATSSHVDGVKLTSGTPDVMTWGDIHDPEDDAVPTLGERFREALEKLERLMYVVWGSVPASYRPFRQWYLRRHPRCMWGSEQIEHKWCGTLAGIPPEPNCEATYAFPYETSALGRSHDIPMPHVPLRSRSGDPDFQFAATPSDPAYFAGFTRSGDQTGGNGASTYDPRGSGYFGGDPARLQASPATNHVREFPWEEFIEGEEVTVTCRFASAKAPVVGAVALITSIGSIAMQQVSSDTWSGTIPKGNHDTQVTWRVDATLAENGGTVVKSSATYSYRAFTHYNPYVNGLPELWSVCRKGTDEYRFDKTESIQPELINLCRFVLDNLAGMFHFDPHRRPKHSACCQSFPIKFRWSGSAPWPHYKRGGKGGPDPADPDGPPLPSTAPLTNYTGEIGGDIGARMTWRGTGRHWHSYLLHENYVYDGSESWLSPPSHLYPELWLTEDDDHCKVYWDGHARGLRAADVIDRVHIEEIIGAVEFLISNGLWYRVPIKTRKKNPPADYGCGWYSDGTGIHYNVGGECCKDYSGGTCTPHDVPGSWFDCWHTQAEGSSLLDSGFGTCDFHYARWRGYECYPSGPYGDGEGYSIACGTPFGCSETLFIWGNSNQKFCHDTPGVASCEFRKCGWSGYVCTPPAYQPSVRIDVDPDPYVQDWVWSNNAPDDLHGNWISKGRNTHACYPNAAAISYLSFGNGIGALFTCGKVIGSESGDMPLGASIPVVMEPGQSPWEGWDCNLNGQCSGSICWNGYDIPELAGYPGHIDPERNEDYDWSICQVSCALVWCVDDNQWYPSAGFTCSVNEYQACSMTETWGAVDLNMDGRGMPTLRDYIDKSSDEKYPNLTSACPCDTLGEPAC